MEKINFFSSEKTMIIWPKAFHMLGYLAAPRQSEIPEPNQKVGGTCYQIFWFL
jgi:hypothetical protein